MPNGLSYCLALWRVLTFSYFAIASVGSHRQGVSVKINARLAQRDPTGEMNIKLVDVCSGAPDSECPANKPYLYRSSPYYAGISS